MLDNTVSIVGWASRPSSRSINRAQERGTFVINKLHMPVAENKATAESAAPRPAIDFARLRALDWGGILLAAVAVVVLVVAVWPVIYFWASDYVKPDSYYSHGPIIPVMIGIMLWHKRDDLRTVRYKPCYPALVVLAPSLVLLVFASRIFPSSLASIALLLVIWSSIWFAAGTDFVRKAWFPIVFLAAMAPLPNMLLTDATNGMQQLSTKLANHLLNAMTFHTALDGNSIQMDNYTMDVDVPCSGFKTLLSMSTFGAAFVYLTDLPAWKRVIFFLLTIPLSLIVNSVRIALIGVVGECLGAPAAHTFHDWSGIITLIVGAMVFFAIAKGMGCRTLAGSPAFS